MDIVYRIKNLKKRAKEFQLMQKIKKKWIVDKKLLPLTPDHWDLYVIIHKLCLKELGEFPHLVDCRDFNDRIQWLKLFDQDEEIVRCSDKILVRDYVREWVGDHVLVDLYQVHDHFDSIDFDALPKSFVMKTNHDSGTVILVRDKASFDKCAARERIENSLKKAYGWNNGEWAYSYIQPKILIEEFINPESDRPPPDYKFHCVSGEVRWLQYIFDRGVNTKECIVDVDGVVMDEHFDQNMHHSPEFTKPKNWNDLLNCASRLAKNFKYVRVDMFESNGKIFVGELTFYPLMGCYKSVSQVTLGQLLDFDRESYKPYLASELERRKSRSSIYPQS